MTADRRTTSYAVEGRLLEVCTCKVLCPCWVGEDPDGDGTCDSILGWYVDRGTVVGVDVSDRCLCLSVHIPGNVLAGNWRAAMLVDDRCTTQQQECAARRVHRPARGPDRRSRGARRRGRRRRAGADRLRRRRRPGPHPGRETWPRPG